MESEGYVFGPYKIDLKEVFYCTALSYAMVNLSTPSCSWMGLNQDRLFLMFTYTLPRKSRDFEKNDKIYDAIDLKEKELKHKLDLDKEIKDRNMEERCEEAEEYRKLFL